MNVMTTTEEKKAKLVALSARLAQRRTEEQERAEKSLAEALEAVELLSEMEPAHSHKYDDVLTQLNYLLVRFRMGAL